MKWMRSVSSPRAFQPETRVAAEAFTAFCRENDLQQRDELGNPIILAEDDPRFPGLLAVLGKHGFTLFPRNTESTHETYLRYVVHSRWPEYGPEDWATAEYLKVRPKVWLNDWVELREPRGNQDVAPLFYLFQRWLKDPADLRIPRELWERDLLWNSSIYGPELLVSERAKSVFESAGLRAVRVLGVDYHYNKPEVASYFSHLSAEEMAPPPWWFLDSDVQLPPVSPTMQWMTTRDPPRLVDRSEPLPPRDRVVPLAEDGIWRYRRADLEAVGPFDLACTYEPEGPRGRRPWDVRRQMVASRRFHELCLREGFEAEWTPVIVED